jgi:hypothetical protein
MNRHRTSMLVVAGAFLLVAGAAAAQGAKPAAPAPAPAQGAPAARPRLVPPVRGVAQIAYTKPVVKREKKEGREFIVTTFRVKNMATGSIAGFKVEEFWYDKAGDPVTGDAFRNPRPLQPGEVITVELNTPPNPKMDRNSYKFSHANGDIKPTLSPKL